MRILVADDDAVVVDVVGRYLRHAGMEVVGVVDGAAALAEIDRGAVDLAVVDVMMPELDGIEVCRSVRAGDHCDLPLILLTALGSADDRVLGLESGADDYVTKPFSPRELTLRVQSVLRRMHPAPPVSVDPGPGVSGELTDGAVRVDLRAQVVTVDDRPLSTTKREFDLIAFLIAHPDEVFGRDELLEQVWGWKFGDQSTVTVHIKRIRTKLGAAAHIDTVWGRGYRWTRDSTPGIR
ncbi:response regulator transcription factor [Gordonia sp. DT219]|uniref:response regulator transcription factor n=1 Tax=Gordonia sp. DT219 TaxID=3416658 RepID=UPI003CEAF076